MKKIMLYSLACCIFLSIAASESVIEKLDPISITIVLDLSDRINLQGQIERDKAIIHEILSAFQKRQKRQAYLLSKDKIRLHISDQPSSTPVINKEGIIVMNKTGFPEYNKQKSLFIKEVNRIYQHAAKEKKNGADIYTTFCSNLSQGNPKNTIPNKIIVITDGYLLFENKYLSKRPKCTYMRKLEEMRAKKEKWKSFFEKEKLQLCPCENQQPKNASVLMLEIANKYRGENPLEFNMIKHYWATWFSGMNIPATILNYSSDPEKTSEAISEFLKEK